MMASLPDKISNRTTPKEYTSTMGDTSPNRAYLHTPHFDQIKKKPCRLEI
jgi:hypothetical protein